MAYDGGAPRRCSSPSSLCVQQTEASGWHLVAPVSSVVSTPSAGVSNSPSSLGSIASSTGLGPRIVAVARPRMASLTDAASLQSDASSSRLGPSVSYRDIGPTISDIRVVLPKSSVSRDFILGCDSPWSGPKRCAAAFAASGADFSLESLVRALPPPLPPPVLLQRTPPSSLDDARNALEPTTLIQTICSGVSGSSSTTYVHQSRVAKAVTGGSSASPTQSTTTASSYTGFPSDKPSEHQISKEVSMDDMKSQQENVVRAITCNVDDAEEDPDDNSSGVATGSAPDVEHNLFNLISCMTKSLGGAGQKQAQHAAGDAPGLQRAPAAAAATVAAAAAAAAIAAATSASVPRPESEGRRPPFVFECSHDPVVRAPSLSSFSGPDTEDADITDQDTPTPVPETKSPSQTLSEFLRAISKENEGGEAYGGRARAQFGTGAAGGGGGCSTALGAGAGGSVAGNSRSGATRAGYRRNGHLQRPSHGGGCYASGRLVSRSQRRGKRRSSARRGRCEAHARRRSRGDRRSATAAPITAPSLRGLSRDRRRPPRAPRRTSADLRRRKHKVTVAQRGNPMARRVPEEEMLAASGAGGTVGVDDSQPPRSYADVLDRLARQDSSPLVRARRVACDKRRRTGGPGSRKADAAGRRGTVQRSGSRALTGAAIPRATTVASLGVGSSSVGGGGGTGGGSGGGAPITMTFPLSGPTSTPRLPGGSPTPRPGTRLEAAVAAAIAAANQSPNGGRICAGTPPAPPPSPVSSKRSAVAAYASNPMLVPPGDAQEAGDCSEDSLAFWLRIICGPQRDGEAVDSLVRSQQVFAECARLLALNPPFPLRSAASSQSQSPSASPPSPPPQLRFAWPSIPGTKRLGPTPGSRGWPPRETRQERERRRQHACERQHMRASTLFTRYLAEHHVKRLRRRAQRNALRRALLAMSVAFAPGVVAGGGSAAPGETSATAPESEAQGAEDAVGSSTKTTSPAESASPAVAHCADKQPTLSPRKCALGAAKTIWARADPPSSPPTQSPPSSKACGVQRRAKLPVYLLPKVSSTKGASLSGAQPPPSSPPPPIWAPQCTQINKGMDCGDWPLASTRFSGCTGITTRAKGRCARTIF